MEVSVIKVVDLGIIRPTAMVLHLVLVVLVGLLVGQQEGLVEGFAETSNARVLVGMMIVTQNAHDFRWVFPFSSVLVQVERYSL